MTSSSRCKLAVVALTLLALAARLPGIGFALPYWVEPDPVLLGQVEQLRPGNLSPEILSGTGIYPHLLARLALLLPGPPKPPDDPNTLPLEEHLDRAGFVYREVRGLISVLSVLIIPATWWLARRFLEPGWALLATAFAATSLLDLQFAGMARPHAASAMFALFGMLACLRLRERGDALSFALAGIGVGLAISALQSGATLFLALALAYLLRANAKRRFFDWRALIVIALLALCVRVFYPFAFVGSASQSLEVEDGEIQLLSDNSLVLKWLNFGGTDTLLLTPWFYEPATLVLAVVGLAFWARRAARTRSSGERALTPDLAVVLAYVLPYTLLLALFARTQQRFVLPLVPYLGCLAAYGVRDLVRALSKGSSPARARLTAVVAVALALAVPVSANVKYAFARAHPHSLLLAARWLREHVDPARQRVAIHPSYDLPVVRQRENLFVGDVPRRSLYTPWLDYQAFVLGERWRGERWWLHPMAVPGDDDLEAIGRDPEAYLRGLDVDYVVVPGFGSRLGLRKALRSIGKLELELRAERLDLESSRHTGLHTPHYTLHVLTTDYFGPPIEIWRLERPIAPSK